MRRAIVFIRDHPQWIYCFAIILLFPALLINLGLMPLLADEATRATVALEMILSGNYILPTIGGDPYYNKPPLFNWILAGAFNLTHYYSEFMVRLTAVVPLLLFSVVIYFFVKKNTDKRVALFSALAMITFARMLFYDSMLGHIDILFSLVTFLSFIAIYHYYYKGKVLQLFLITYICTAVGFLMKGLPSLVFQAVSLLVIFVSNKNYKPLFGYKHMLGIALFICITGLYYIALSEYVTLDVYYQTLFEESGKRTMTGKGLMNNILYIFQFPFEQILFHLLPWGLLVVFCLNKNFWNHMRKDRFLNFLFLILLFNILIYWISPETRPRYLFMLYPLVFVLLFTGYFQYKDSFGKLNTFFDAVILSFAIISCLGMISIPFINFGKAVIPYFFLKWAILLLLILFITWLTFSIKEQRLILLIILMLSARVVFDLFVLPHRLYNGKEKFYREQMQHIAAVTKDDSLYLHQNIYLKHSEHFYLDVARNSIPGRIDTLAYKKGFMLIDHQMKHPHSIQLLDSFRVEWLDRKIYLIRSHENIISRCNGSQ